jgi:hypothetical protein
MSKKNTSKSQSKPASQQPDGEVETTTGAKVIKPYVSPSGEKGSDDEPVKREKKGKGLQFGNQDKEKKYDLSRLNIPDGHVVVRHFGTVKLANGQEMEDPTTNRLQVYDEATYDALNKQGVKDGKQTPSQFEVLGMNVDVLHLPK